MNYADKCMITILTQKVAPKTGIDILLQYGVLKGKNTVSITVEGVENLFTEYEAAKTYLNSL